MIFFLSGSGLGSFCMDCTFTSYAADGASLGDVAGISILWACILDSCCLFSSLARTNDDEIQVTKQLWVVFSTNGSPQTYLNFSHLAWQP